MHLIEFYAVHETVPKLKNARWLFKIKQNEQVKLQLFLSNKKANKPGKTD